MKFSKSIKTVDGDVREVCNKISESKEPVSQYELPDTQQGSAAEQGQVGFTDW